jgi:hypothetical protein
MHEKMAKINHAQWLISQIEALQAKAQKVSPFALKPILEQMGEKQTEFNKSILEIAKNG